VRALLVGWFGALLAAQQPAAGDPPAIVEVAPAATTVWLHQPVDVTVRLLVDPAFFATQAVPLFQQPMDRPFHVVVPWLFAAEDRAVEFVPPAAGTNGPRIAVGDAVVVAVPAGTERRGTREFEVLTLRYRWTPLVAGTSAIAPVELRYAFATRFEEDFLRGRQPIDRQDASVVSTPGQLTVQPLPTAGRPAGFTGAVGDFTVTAAVDVPRVPLGGTFALSVTVRGDGNLERFAPMPAPELDGFHVQGTVERRIAGARTFVFDVLALREGDTAVPALSFAAFSPSRGAWVTHTVGPVPIVVGPAAGPLEPRVRELVDALANESRSRLLRTWATVVTFVVLLAVGLHFVRRRRAWRRARLRAAFDTVAAAADPGSRLAAFEALCALCAGHDRFAADATWQTLRDTEAHEPLVADAERLHRALDAARFGGAPVARDDLLRVAAALRAHGEVVAA